MGEEQEDLNFFDKLSGMKKVPMMGMIEGLTGVAQGLIGRKKRREDQRKANREYESRKEDFKNTDTSNLYAGVKNQWAENVYEDVTVNTQQAEFQAQQQAQSQANIMQGLSGAAGGSGIAGLAQALANQSTQANQQASASIGAQESRNQELIGRGQLNVQRGAAEVDQLRLQGAETSRTLATQKAETLFGMSQADKAVADKAVADANSALWGGVGKIAGSVVTGGII